MGGHGARQVVDGVGLDVDHATPQDGAAVADFAAALDVDTVAAQECACGQEVACAHHGVDLRHQGFGAGAISELHGLLFQPDDVGGEQGHLRGRQCNAWAQLLGAGVA